MIEMENPILKTGMPLSRGADFLYEILWTRVYSYSLEIAIKTPLFNILHQRSLTLGEIADTCDMGIASARVLAQYLCGLGLLKMEDDRFSATEVADMYLGNGRMIGDLIGFAPESLAAFESRLKNPPQQPWYNMRNSGQHLSAINGINHDFFIADTRHQWRISKGEELSSVYDFGKHTKMIDIGGASGGWCVGIRKSNPHLQCTVYDLPEVAALVENASEKLGHDSMISIVKGNIFEDSVPTDADVILLANVLHDWSDTDCLVILNKVYDSLPVDGVVLVTEFFMNDDWRGPLGSMFQAVTVLGPDGESGWQPSFMEMEAILEKAGFVIEQRKENLVVGRKATPAISF